MGLAPRCIGAIKFAGLELIGRPSHAIARAGIGFVPEGRQVFPTLTVEENLLVAANDEHAEGDPWTLERVYRLFPRLGERSRHLGDQLSGGEQQMVAIARALMTNPKLLILDEATEGLAPLVRAEIWAVLEALKSRRESILVIDKNLDALLRIADRHYILENGRVVWSGNSAALDRPEAPKSRYLGV